MSYPSAEVLQGGAGTGINGGSAGHDGSVKTGVEKAGYEVNSRLLLLLLFLLLLICFAEDIQTSIWEML